MALISPKVLSEGGAAILEIAKINQGIAIKGNKELTLFKIFILRDLAEM